MVPIYNVCNTYTGMYEHKHEQFILTSLYTINPNSQADI